MSAEGTWPLQPARLSFRRQEVHVWRAALDLPRSLLEDLARTLSEDEHAQADRFVSTVDKRRFVARRGALRMLLGTYLGREPGSILLCYGDTGKPRLDRPSRFSLRFNSSHSDDLALYAFAAGTDVGVDVERIRPSPWSERIAERFFSPWEAAQLRAVPRDRRPESFFRCWTRKEAFAKAVGTGLALSLDRFDVSVGPSEPPALLRLEGDPEAPDRWGIRDLNPSPGYVGAVAVKYPDAHITTLDWTYSQRSPTGWI
jgi:4'-phosphopantetheinyl transferase